VKCDNSTPHIASQYDVQVRSTIPYYDSFHDETIKLLKSMSLQPRIWLDTGCGTGTFAKKALLVFPNTRFVLADPSGEMLTIAKQKLKIEFATRKVKFLKPVSTQDLSGYQDRFDVITAIQSHHYLMPLDREKATCTCFEMLKVGGVYVTFENVRPMTRKGLDIGKEYWEQFQIENGKDRAAVRKHFKRFDTEFFPITPEDHLLLLGRIGFSVVEFLWFSYMQAGFYCVK
jgi:tRNA (cmo5U34)-methyltransferase